MIVIEGMAIRAAQHQPSEAIMEAPIVAGIIDTRTGEILETVTKPSEKTRLHLKVRDELDPEHGRFAFMTFELNSMGGLGNLDFIRRNMLSDDPDILKGVYLLNARYDVASLSKSLDRAEAELALAEQVKEECLALYNDNAEKRSVVEDAFSHEEEESQEAVRSISFQLRQRKDRLRKLESELNQSNSN